MAGKKLYLLRHAEAVSLDPGGLDQNRELTQTGIHQAEYMGRKLAAMGVVPDLLLASPARRTRQTADLIAPNLQYPPDGIQDDPRIYNAVPRTMLEIINALDDRYQAPMIVGHNPTISQMVSSLTQHSINIMPTCGIVCITLEPEAWSYVSLGSGNFEWFEMPPASVS